MLGSRYGGKRQRREFFLTPFDVGEHWSEQAKPKGIGRGEPRSGEREAGTPNWNSARDGCRPPARGMPLAP